MPRTITYDLNWDEPRDIRDPELLDVQPHSCDLCYCRLDAPDATFMVIEGRAVCPGCEDRFSLEPPKPNRTIGLMQRGEYAARGTPPPPSNNLGGRD